MPKNKHSDGLVLLSLIVGHKAYGLDFISSHFARSCYEYGTSSVKHKPFRMKDTLRCKNDIATENGTGKRRAACRRIGTTKRQLNKENAEAKRIKKGELYTYITYST